MDSKEKNFSGELGMGKGSRTVAGITGTLRGVRGSVAFGFSPTKVNPTESRIDRSSGDGDKAPPRPGEGEGSQYL